MYLVAIGWMYVVLMMAVVEAAAANGTVLGAVITFVLYGVLPMSIVLYVMGTPMRRRKRLRLQTADSAEQALPAAPDDGRLPAGDAVAAERKEV